MAKLGQGEVSDCANPVLDVMFKLGGAPIDVASLEYQIFETVTAPPALTQVFPAVAGTRQTVDLTDCPAGDRVSTGRYVGRWTVPISEPVGTHVIKWFWKQTSTSPEREFCEEFEVVQVAASSSSLGYCSVADLRAEGVPTTVADDATLQAAITRASRMVDMFTGQWFEPRTLSFNLDGRNSPTLFLGFPIISVTQVTLDGVVLVGEIQAYNRHLTQNLITPDDRQNPRIELIQPRIGSLLTTTSQGRRVFPRGQSNVLVDGVFGYTDFDGSNPQGQTPLMICHVTKLIVMRELWRMFDQADDRDDAARRRVLKVLRTRDQRIEYADPYSAGAGRQGVGAFTGDPEIDNILLQFRRPMRIGSVGGSAV